MVVMSLEPRRNSKRLGRFKDLHRSIRPTKEIRCYAEYATSDGSVVQAACYERDRSNAFLAYHATDVPGEVIGIDDLHNNQTRLLNCKSFQMTAPNFLLHF